MGQYVDDLLDEYEKYYKPFKEENDYIRNSIQADKISSIEEGVGVITFCAVGIFFIYLGKTIYEVIRDREEAKNKKKK